MAAIPWETQPPASQGFPRPPPCEGRVPVIMQASQPCAYALTMCHVLSSQEKSLTDAHGKGVSGDLREVMS